MLGRLLALFLITPVVELALLYQIGDVIGFWPTIAIIVVTGVTGTYLAKREGLSVWRRFNDRLHQGDLPGRELLDGVIILVAGALLITPGVLTDVVGFIGLIPITRSLVRGYLNRRIQKAARSGSVRFPFGGFESFSESGSPTGPPSEPAEPSWQGSPRERPRSEGDTPPRKG